MVTHKLLRHAFSTTFPYPPIHLYKAESLKKTKAAIDCWRDIVYSVPTVEQGWLAILQTLDNLKNNKAKASVNTSDSDGNQVFSSSVSSLIKIKMNKY